MMLVTLHRLFTDLILLIIAVNTTQNVMAVSAAAFALPPSSVSNEKNPEAIVDEVEKDIKWMDDWMLRFGGVARYVVVP